MANPRAFDLTFALDLQQGSGRQRNIPDGRSCTSLKPSCRDRWIMQKMLLTKPLKEKLNNVSASNWFMGRPGSISPGIVATLVISPILTCSSLRTLFATHRMNYVNLPRCGFEPEEPLEQALSVHYWVFSGGADGDFHLMYLNHADVIDVEGCILEGDCSGGAHTKDRRIGQCGWGLTVLSSATTIVSHMSFGSVPGTQNSYWVEANCTATVS